MGDEIKVIWNGHVSHVRSAMKEFEIKFGKKITFPIYFKDKAMIIPGGEEVEYNSEIYMYIDDYDRPRMEVAMPTSRRNVDVKLIVEGE